MIMSLFGTIIRETFGTWMGGLFNPFDAHEAMVALLYGVSSYADMPASWLPFGAFVLLTILATRFLVRRITAYEVA